MRIVIRKFRRRRRTEGHAVNGSIPPRYWSGRLVVRFVAGRWPLAAGLPRSHGTGGIFGWRLQLVREAERRFQTRALDCVNFVIFSGSLGFELGRVESRKRLSHDNAFFPERDIGPPRLEQLTMHIQLIYGNANVLQ